jgi:hypothetical protein
MIRIVDVPKSFLPKMPIEYPPHQGSNPMIEERAYSFFTTKEEIQSECIYIPIQWTSWHINPGGEFGKNTQPLVNFCDELVSKHPDEKFFTIVQYDGGTLIPIDNCKIFASSGNFLSPLGKNSVYEPIPLLCNPHDGIPKEIREYKVGYVGKDTHPIRFKMNRILSNFPGYNIIANNEYNKTKVFRDVLYNSVFALAPRGFGPASFRMYEAIQMQCIPIYISDEFWLPFSDDIEWEKMSLLIKEDEIETIPEKVDILLDSGEYQNMIDYGQYVYQKYLTYNGCLNTIVQKIENYD